MTTKRIMAGFLVVGIGALPTVAAGQLPVPAPVESAPVAREVLEIVRTDFDPRELASGLDEARSRPEAPGQQLFVSRCALCHDPLGQPGGLALGPWLDADLVSTRGEPAVRTAILDGSANMPGFRHQFDAAQVDRIIAYLKTVPSDVPAQVPTADKTNPAAWGTTAEPTILLAGTTRTASGQPLHGVAVSARAVDSNFTTTVYSDEQGEYFFPALHEGRYRVWAQATGYRTERVEALPDTRADQAFTLRPIGDVTPQLRGPEWLAALPEETFEDRRLKEIFRVQCSECHQAGIPLQNRFDEQGWLAVIAAMEKAGYNGLNARSSRPPAAMRHHRAELAKYLARMRGPGPSPMKLEPMLPRPTGDAARVVITEYDVPPADTGRELVLWNGEDWSEGTPSGQHGGRSGLHDVAIDQDGNAWITTWGSVTQSLRTLVKLDPATGMLRSYNVVRKSPSDSVYTHGIYVDQQGILWFNLSGILGRVDPETDEITTFTPPAGMRVNGTLDVDPFGKVWAGSPQGVLRFDPEQRTFQYFQNPTPTGGTYGVTGDALGNGWWGRWTRDVVGHADTKTGKTSEIPMLPPDAPAPESFMTDADRQFYYNQGARRFMGGGPYTPGAQAPRRMGADKNGDVIWVGNWWGGNLAAIDIRTLEPTYHQLPFKGMHPYSAVVNNEHMVYTNVSSDDSVAKFDPIRSEWTIYPLPSRGSEVRHIAVDGRTGDVWVPYASTSRIARLQFRTAEQLQALRADQ